MRQKVMRCYRNAEEVQVNLNFKISKMLQALQYLEWSHVEKTTQQKCCPDCGNFETEGHWKGCYISKALNCVTEKNE